MASRDPLAGYTPDWRTRSLAVGGAPAEQAGDPLAGYSPDWRTQQRADEPEEQERPGIIRRVLDSLRPDPSVIADQQALRDYGRERIEGPTGSQLRGVSAQNAAARRQRNAERGSATTDLQDQLRRDARTRIEGPTGSRPRDTRPPEERDVRIAEQSGMGEAAAGVGRGVGQIVESAGGFVRLLDEGNFLPMPENDVGERVAATGRRIRERPSLQPSDAAGTETFDPGNPAWWLARAPEQVPQLALSLGAAALTGGVGPAAFMAFAGPTFVQEAGSAYQSGYSLLRERGLSERESAQGASGVAMLTGAGAAALERLPFASMILGRVPGADRIFAQAFTERLAASAAGRAGARLTGNALTEGVEEAAQGAWADALAYTSSIDPDAFADWQERYAASGALGAVTGAGATAVTPAAPVEQRPSVPRPTEEQILARLQQFRERDAQEATRREEIITEANRRHEQNLAAALEAEERGELPPVSVEMQRRERETRLRQHEAIAGPPLPPYRPRARAEPAAPSQAIERPEDLEVPPNIGYATQEDLDLEPERFQYKLNTGERGVTRALQGVRQWDENMAGVIQVWRDPEDGRLKVVNGHHRVDLARRLGVGRMLVRELGVATPEEARTVGALTNIAEGRGTPMDAAKLFRDSGMSEEDVRQAGIPLTESTARDGLALAQLAQPLFDRAVRGDLPVGVASAIGRGGLTEPQQLSLTQLIDRQRGRMSATRVEELIRHAKDAPTIDITQETLFGEETMAESLLLEKSDLSAWVKTQLLQDARLARQAGRNAERLAELGIAEVDRETASETASETADRAALVGELYNRLSTRGGPVASALNDAARAQREGGSRGEIRTQLYTAVEGAVRAELQAVGRGEGARAPRSEGEPAGRAPREGAAPEPQEAEALAGVDTETGSLFDEPAAPTPPEGTPPARRSMPTVDDMTARRVGMPRDLADDVNLLSEEARWRQALSTAGARVRHDAEEWVGDVMVPAEFDDSTGGPVVVRSAEHPGGRVYRATEFSPTDEAGGRVAGMPDVQDDLFGGPAEVTGEEQRELGFEAEQPSLTAAESQARATVDRLGLLIERGAATPAQREQYREALALLRRSESQSAEEVRLRAEGGTEPGDTGELFEPMLDAPNAGAAERAPRRAARPSTAVEENPPMTGESVEVGSRTYHPIAPVELARIASQLLGGEGTTRVFMKRYPKARGAFYPDPSFPRIGLNPRLGQDYDQFARTLAHEVGHLIDFLPDLTMNRGNILGRLATLKSYLSETIDRLPSDPSRALTRDDRKVIRRAAEKEVGPKPKGEAAAITAWREEVTRVYAVKIAEEIEARDLLLRERVHEELHTLSMWWRPYDPTTVSPSFARYRASSPEIYADALSVLLNDPAALQARAPLFFESFIAYSDRKPDMRMTYDAVQSLIGTGEDALMAARRDELEADFERGEEIQREAEERKDPQGIRSYLKQLFLERGSPLSDAERRRVGRVPAHSEQRAVRMALQEHQHADNVNRIMLMDIEHEVHTPMLEAGITPEQAGRFLMLQRIAEGDRGGMAEQAKEAIMELTGERTWEAARAAYAARANDETTGDEEFDPDLLELARTGLLNPRGYTPAEAERTLQALERELGKERYQTLDGLMTRFRDILFGSVETAVALGSYNKQVFTERILPNRATYTPFAVLDYFNGRVSAGVKRQIGTLKGIANPYTSALLKAMAVNRLNEYQRVKLQILKVLDVDFPGMAGEERAIDKFHTERKPGPGRENLLYLKDGKLYYREVDAYIAKVLDQADLGAVGRLARALSTKTYALFHPLYVTWSLGWQVRNIQRDWKRTYKNLATTRAGQPTYRQAMGAILDVVRLNRSYMRTMGAAWRNARRQHDPLVRAMLHDRALGRAFHSFEQNTDDAKYERLLQRYGIREPTSESAKEKVRKIGRVIETLGVFQETWSKAAAFQLLGDLGFSDRERAFIVRNYVGTPDSTQRGLASDGVNGVIMYANVIMAGLRADAEVALQPQTAAGYWLRSVLIDFAPKAAMAAAIAGLFGDELEEWIRRVPSYDLEKYFIIPFPPFVSVNALGETKSVYLRMPHDDVNRILAGSLWSMLMSGRPHRISRSLGLVSGEFGGLNPALTLPWAWYQVARDKNPEDTFRGRPIVPPTQWEAGGWQRWKEVIRYTLGEFGIASQMLGYFTRTSPDESRSTFLEALLRSVPGVSSLVKVSDRGQSERRDWELEWEARERAKIRADLSRDVRRALGERAGLNRLGMQRLTPRERGRRAQLNAWYRLYMLHTAAMERARDTEDRAGYERSRQTLEQSVRALNANRPRARRRAPAAQ